MNKPPVILKIDVKKLNKDWFFKANSGAVYVDLVLYENDEPDEYGSTHAIKQNPPKAERDQGVKGHYVGNGKRLEGSGSRGQRQKPSGAARPQAQQKDDWEEDDIPF